MNPFRKTPLVAAALWLAFWCLPVGNVHAQVLTIDWTKPENEYALGVGVPKSSSCPVRVSMRMMRPPQGVPSYSLIQFRVRPVVGRTFPSDGTVTIRLQCGAYSPDEQMVIIKIPVRSGAFTAESEMLARLGMNTSWIFIYGEWNGRPFESLNGQATMTWTNFDGLPMRLQLVSSDSVVNKRGDLVNAFERMQETGVTHLIQNDITNTINGNFNSNVGQLSSLDWIADVNRMPKSWLTWAHFDEISVSLADLRKIDEAGLKTLSTYVWCGGKLRVSSASRPSELDGLLVAYWDRNLTPKTSQTQTYRAGLGAVLLESDPLRENSRDSANSERSRLIRLSGDLGSDYWTWLIPEVGKTPIWAFLGIVILIVGVGAPSILIWSQRIQRRVWIILAIPVFSLASVLTLFLYAAVKDGWTSLVRIRSITTLDSDGNGAVWSRQNYFAGNLPGGKIQVGADTELIPLQAGKAYSVTQHQEETGQDQVYSGVLSLRQQRQVSITHRVEGVKILQMERSDSAHGLPPTKNVSGAKVRAVVCSDGSGGLFRAENTPPGQTLVWTEISPKEAVGWLNSIYREQDLVVPVDAPDSGSRSIFNWLSGPNVNWRSRVGSSGFLEEAYWQDEIADWGADSPCKFIAFLDHAPQLEKCLENAKETGSLHMVVGRWRPLRQKPLESASQANESDGKGLQQEGFGEE